MRLPRFPHKGIPRLGRDGGARRRPARRASGGTARAWVHTTRLINKQERSWEPRPKEHRTKSQQVKSSCTCALQVFKAFKIPEYRPIGRSRPKPQVRDTAELPCGKSVNRGASRSRRRGGTSTSNVTKSRSLGIITSLHITSSTFPSADK
jgi:hypothetical protein